jgi:hypothetical protein
MIALPSPELATFRSAMAGATEFRRTVHVADAASVSLNDARACQSRVEPDVGGPGYDAWYEQHGERLDGVWKVAERILAGKAPAERAGIKVGGINLRNPSRPL